MPSIQVPASELLRAVETMEPNELEQFAANVVALRNQRLLHGVNMSEAELLRLARQSLPPDVEQRFAELRSRRRAETITSEEMAELLHITTLSEYMNVSRIEALATLARRRNVTLPQVMDQLGIKAPPYE